MIIGSGMHSMSHIIHNMYEKELKSDCIGLSSRSFVVWKLLRSPPMNPAEKVPQSKSFKALMPLKRDHALLDPGQLSGMAEEAAHDLMAEGESDNTRLAYRAAMRYWAAWFGARYGQQMALPVAVPVVVQFI